MREHPVGMSALVSKTVCSPEISSDEDWTAKSSKICDHVFRDGLDFAGAVASGIGDR